jgi:DNA modification methylase
MPQFTEHNALDKFPLLPDSVNLVVTSPPYWKLRDYDGDIRQIGQEKTPQEYVEHLLQVGVNIWNVLTDDGSYFLNIGDTYDKHKSLVLIPHRVAIAMRDSGWILRNTIIWHKPNPMPSACKDRLTLAHEYVFHFVKQRKYYYDLDSIRQPHQTLKIERFLNNENLAAKLGKKIEVVRQESLVDLETSPIKGYKKTKLKGQPAINQGARRGFNRDGEHMENRYADGGKNPGDVFHEEELRTAAIHDIQGEGEKQERADMYWLKGFEIECPECGSQFQTDFDDIYSSNPEDLWTINVANFADAHYAVFPEQLVKKIVKLASRENDTVLDPFSGSGTTAIVAESLSRKGIGFDLSFDDVRNRRVQQGIECDLLYG